MAARSLPDLEGPAQQRARHGPMPQAKGDTGGGRRDSGIGRAICLAPQKARPVAFTYVKAQEDRDANDTIQMIKELKKDASSKDPIYCYARQPRPQEQLTSSSTTTQRSIHIHRSGRRSARSCLTGCSVQTLLLLPHHHV